MSKSISTLAIEAGIIPNEQQTLLLKACTNSGKHAIDAFRDWMDTLDLERDGDLQPGAIGLPQMYDQLDLGSQRLLSLLYKNMIRNGLDHPMISKLSGYYKYVWYKNNLLKSRLTKLVQDLQSINVDVIIIKGIALIEKYYDDYGMRPTIDIDIAVRKENISKTIDLLLESGWKSKIGNPYLLIHSQTHAHTFVLNNIELDLHCEFSSFPISKESEDKFWTTAIPQEAGYLMLQPPHELFCTLLHGFQWNTIPPIRWVADATIIVRKFKNEDWDKFYDLMETERHVIPLQMFTYLREHSFITMPDSIIDLSVSKKQTYTIQSHLRLGLIPRTDIIDLSQALFIFYKIRSRHGYNPVRGFKAFADHYKYLWNKGSYFQLIIPGLKKLHKAVLK